MGTEARSSATNAFPILLISPSVSSASRVLDPAGHFSANCRLSTTVRRSVVCTAACGTH